MKPVIKAASEEQKIAFINAQLAGAIIPEKASLDLSKQVVFSVDILNTEIHLDESHLYLNKPKPPITYFVISFFYFVIYDSKIIEVGFYASAFEAKNDAQELTIELKEIKNVLIVDGRPVVFEKTAKVKFFWSERSLVLLKPHIMITFYENETSN